MNSYSVANKRALEIPDVRIDETLLKTLEKQFATLGGENWEMVNICVCIYTKFTVSSYCDSHNI